MELSIVLSDTKAFVDQGKQYNARYQLNETIWVGQCGHLHHLVSNLFQVFTKSQIEFDFIFFYMLILELINFKNVLVNILYICQYLSVLLQLTQIIFMATYLDCLYCDQCYLSAFSWVYKACDTISLCILEYSGVFEVSLDIKFIVLEHRVISVQM